jgi:hypothetical protein
VRVAAHGHPSAGGLGAVPSFYRQGRQDRQVLLLSEGAFDPPSR